MVAGADNSPIKNTPDPGQHRTLFYGESANRVRGERHTPEAEEWPVAAEPPRRSHGGYVDRRCPS
jgi:hypothetical protein